MKKPSRHGQRAPGKTLLTFTLTEELKADLQTIALEEERTMSNLISRALTRFVKTYKEDKAFRAQTLALDEQLEHMYAQLQEEERAQARAAQLRKNGLKK